MRGRFAPSPTGRLHLGNARTALLGWLSARSQGGQFLLRIEDLDRGRCRPQFVDELFRDLDYLGLTWDEQPLYQSQRGELYRQALDKLQRMGAAYPCFCTRQEIARAAAAPHGPADDGPVYPGTCARLSPPEVAERRQDKTPGWRFRVKPGVVEFEDGIHGRCQNEVAAQVGDFVVWSKDGVASYQLAVVVDDAATGITEVLRGEDLLSSTGRQLQLYQALALSPPRFAHVPLVLGEDGKRLAKREGASAVSELREAGVPAERVVGLLARWCGLSDGRPVQASELIAGFSLQRISPAPPVALEHELQSLLDGPRK